jgi:hypothetical protein
MPQRNYEMDAFFEKAINYDGYDCLLWRFGFAGGYPAFDRMKEQYGTRVISRVICIIKYGAPPS